MNETDHLVKSLEELCKREGGMENVALEIGANKTYLWQIINATSMPSGKPRGIGRNLREKLDKKFPGWATKQYSMSGDTPTFTLPTRKPEDEFSPLASLLARMFDKIPEDDLLGRSQAFNAASIEIRAVLDSKRQEPAGS